MNSNPNLSPPFKQLQINTNFEALLKKRYISPVSKQSNNSPSLNQIPQNGGSKTYNQALETYSFEDNELKAKISKVKESK